MKKYEIEFNQCFLGNREIIEAETEDEALEKLDNEWGTGVGAELELITTVSEKEI